jgi:hypothetical protein
VKTLPSIAAVVVSVVSVVSLGALAACSATVDAVPSSDGGAGTNLAVSRVTIESQMGPGVEPGVNDAAKCQLTTAPWIIIGDAAHAVSNGDTQAGAKVAVQCRVAVDGPGYAVSAKATLGGDSIEIAGHFQTQGVQPTIRAIFTRGDTGSFAEEDCTARYATNTNQGVATGRVWAVLDCPHAVFAAQSRTCLGTAEFKFENCTQE